MELLNRMVVASLPLVPRPVVRRLAARYIAGETVEDAVRTVRGLNASGACATLDVLGEDVGTKEEAIAAREACVEALQAISRERLDSNLSIKLTSLGLKVEKAFCLENLRALLGVASELGLFVRFDMEDSSCTDDTLELFRAARRDFPRVGLCVQAYLRRTAEDVRALVAEGTSFRLVKGIYREPEAIAFQGREEIRQSYLALLEAMLRGGCYVGIATHDDVLVEGAERLVRELGLGRDRYEFQMLLGVLPELRARILKAGHRVRIYVPYGRNWYGYSTRRFKENPTVAGYVFRAMFHRAG